MSFLSKVVLGLSLAGSCFAYKEVRDETGVRVEFEGQQDYQTYMRQMVAHMPADIAQHIAEVVERARLQANQTRRRLSSSPSTGDLETMLDLHNSLRSQTALGRTSGEPAASNMNKLLWDDALADVAQTYASKCYYGHNSNRESDLSARESEASFLFDDYSLSVGENIAASYSSSGDVYSLDKALAGIQAWFDEYSVYSYSSQACGGQCGHYTQMAWADTRYLGCGAAACNYLGGAGWSNAFFLVCDYFPAGNDGGKPYVSGNGCSDCASDRTSCDGGLCSGCPAPGFAFCSDYYSNCADLTQWCPSSCSLSSSDSLCKGCRTSCDSCPSSYVQPPANCDDGFGRSV